MSTSNKGYVRLPSDPSSSDTFVHDTLEQQQRIIEGQDETLEMVGSSLKTIKDMSSQIGYELGEQSDSSGEKRQKRLLEFVLRMLDELSSSMATTDSRMNNVMKKLAKLSHLEDDDRQCTAIFVLLGLIVILMFILIL